MSFLTTRDLVKDEPTKEPVVEVKLKRGAYRAKPFGAAARSTGGQAIDFLGWLRRQSAQTRNHAQEGEADAIDIEHRHDDHRALCPVGFQYREDAERFLEELRERN